VHEVAEKMNKDGRQEKGWDARVARHLGGIKAHQPKISRDVAT